MYASLLQDVCKSNCADAKFKISPAYNGLYFAAPIKSAQDIGIWFLKDEPVTLSAHHCPITALSFCDLSHGNLLCSCSDDNIILWDLSQYIGNEESFHGIVLYSGMSGISLCCFDNWEHRIAFCCDKSILILDVKTREILKHLTHTATISGCIFSCKDIVISISSDSICKVWNICTGFSPCYKVIGGDLSVLTANHNMLAVVTTSGKIESFWLDSERRLQHITLYKIWKLIRDAKKRHLTDSYSGKSNDAKEVDEANYDENVQVLAMKFLKFAAASDSKTEHHSLSESCICAPIFLFVVTTTGFLIVNTQNEMVIYYAFQENAEELPSIMISAAIFATDTQVNLVLIPFSGCVFYNCTINASHITSRLENQGSVEIANSLSFLSIRDVPMCSLLLKEVQRRENKKKGKCPAKSLKMAQPLTFHSHVRSSGYNLPPRNKLFYPVVNRRKDVFSVENEKPKLLPPRKNIIEGSSCNYWEKQPILMKKVQLSSHSNITVQHITVCNKVAAFGFGDGLIEVTSLPQLNIVASLLYHNGNITSVHFSHSDCSKLLLSGSSDRKISIWDWKGHRQKPLLVIDSVSKSQESIDKKKAPIPEEVTAAQFYYLDKFILFSFGNVLNMSLYHIDPVCSDIKRYKTNSFHHNVLSMQLECKRINALAAINQFHSYLVLCATSSGAICILDMNTGKTVCSITEVHSRPVYQIVLNEGSSHVGQPPEMHDVYGTAALTDGLKLWDLRTSRCIMYWKEHPNRCHPCRADISACGKYVVAGGEDKAVYIYDIRMARIVHKLKGHSDAVSNTNFLPAISKILAAAYDCNAYVYGSDIL